MQYFKTLDLTHDYKFGVEIEFYGAYLELLAKKALKNNLPIKYVLGHKNKDFTFRKWCLDEDSTVSSTENDTPYGGEISSKILKDHEADWLELKRVCEFLRESKVTINKNCSSHIHVSLDKFSPFFIEYFSKIVSLFETEIKTFYMGEKYLVRKTSYEWASDLNPVLLEKILSINFDETDDDIYKVMYNQHASFTLRMGINLQEFSKNNLIEIRYPNGTLNEVIIQNNINFTLKLIDSILNRKWDICVLNEMIKDKLSNYNETIESIYLDKTNDESFYQLVNTITTRDADKNNFIEQYQRVLSTKKVA